MIQRAHVRGAVLGLLVFLLTNFLFSQQTEGRRKTDTTPKIAAKTAAVDDKDADKEKDQKNEGDPLFKGMKYRSIGPFRGGRSLTAVGIPGDPTTYYFGSTGGGVWKSIDGANTWSPIFYKEGTSAIG